MDRNILIFRTLLNLIFSFILIVINSIIEYIYKQNIVSTNSQFLNLHRIGNRFNFYLSKIFSKTFRSLVRFIIHNNTYHGDFKLLTKNLDVSSHFIFKK